jgi:hypothetical protein
LSDNDKKEHVLSYYTDEELENPHWWKGEFPPLRLVKIQQVRVGDLFVTDYRQLKNRDVNMGRYYLVVRLVMLPFLDRENKTYEMDTLDIGDNKISRHAYDKESAFRWFLVSRI